MNLNIIIVRLQYSILILNFTCGKITDFICMTYSNFGQSEFNSEFFWNNLLIFIFFNKSISFFEHALSLFKFLLENIVIKVHQMMILILLTGGSTWRSIVVCETFQACIQAHRLNTVRTVSYMTTLLDLGH